MAGCSCVQKVLIGCAERDIHINFKHTRYLYLLGCCSELSTSLLGYVPTLPGTGQHIVLQKSVLPPQLSNTPASSQHEQLICKESNHYLLFSTSLQYTISCGDLNNCYQ